MGLFQNLLETYEKCSAIVGIVQTDADGNANEKKTLLPIGHTTFQSQICVTLSEDGQFISAIRDNKPITIIIPCTDDSEGRSGRASFAHVLCDKLEYVSTLDSQKISKYLDQLDKWRKFASGISQQILNSVYTYINSKTLLNDLFKSKLFKAEECVSDGINDIKFLKKKNSSDKDEIIAKNLGVRFIVNIANTMHAVWEDKDLRQQWIMYIEQNTERSVKPHFDYISGYEIQSIGRKHPKKIIRKMPGAKLLSCNDTSEFTFRGRFEKQDDAVIIDYAQSQKMHQMLRWLIANYGYHVDSQVIITWAVDSDTEVKAKAQDNSFDLFGNMEEIKTDAAILSEVGGKVIYANYAKKLKQLLQGYGNVNSIKQHARKICIAIFDAATTGRMGLVFYQELPENTYLENIVNWHSDTSYFLTAWKKVKDENDRDTNVPIYYIGAPSYDDILFAVYGKSRGEKSYDTLKKKTRKQLLECMFGNFAFPKSMVEMAANRASNPMSFTDSNGKFSENDLKRAINITCALTRKYYKEQKEEIQLELETSRTDRDYLFGRLLSIADKLERTALYKADKQDTRATNATRLMSAFQIKPYSTWGQLYNQLIPYKNQLNGAGFYQSLIDDIMTLFQNGDYEDNSPLSPLYLLGYSAQNRVLSNKNKNEKEVTDNGNTSK
jgi:CRISPR-associated protein Csd1